MEKHSTIFVAGHKGLVGSALVRKLKEEGYTNIITRNRQQCDLTNPIQVKAPVSYTHLTLPTILLV